jgi:tetratricopeptide (TPR) repeat protein
MTALASILLMMLAAAGGPPASGSSEPPAPAAADGDALFRRGVAAYDAGDYKGAIEAFTAAHRLSKAPEILFDIGQAFRALGDCRQAAESFDAFIAAAAADDPLLAKAKARRSELASCAAADTVRPKTERVVAVPPAAPKPAISPLLGLEMHPAGVAPRSGKWTACTVAAGSTIAVGATGLGLGVAAWLKASDVEDRKQWGSEAQQADARGRAFADASAVTLVTAGIAGLVVGATCWRTWRDDRSSRSW